LQSGRFSYLLISSPFTWTGLGRVLARKKPGDMDRVEECFIKGLEILDVHTAKPCYAQGSLFLGEFCLAAGEREKALENLKKAEGIFRVMGMDYWLGRAQEVLAAL